MSAYQDLLKEYGEVIASNRAAKAAYEGAAAAALGEIEALQSRLGCPPDRFQVRSAKTGRWMIAELVLPSARGSSKEPQLQVPFVIYGAEGGGASVRVDGNEYAAGQIASAFIDAFRKRLKDLAYVPPGAPTDGT
jgi:hypothetical protein